MPSLRKYHQGYHRDNLAVNHLNLLQQVVLPFQEKHTHLQVFLRMYPVVNQAHNLQGNRLVNQVVNQVVIHLANRLLSQVDVLPVNQVGFHLVNHLLNQVDILPLNRLLIQLVNHPCNHQHNHLDNQHGNQQTRLRSLQVNRQAIRLLD